MNDFEALKAAKEGSKRQKMQKKCKKFWRYEILLYLCTRNWEETSVASFRKMRK